MGHHALSLHDSLLIYTSSIIAVNSCLIRDNLQRPLRRWSVPSSWRTRSTCPDFLRIWSSELNNTTFSSRPPPSNVLPLVNKGLALFQFKQDISATEQCCQEALRIDSEPDAAVATLAQLSLQQGMIDFAIEMLDRQAELARTEPELVGALTYKYISALVQSFVSTRKY